MSFSGTVPPKKAISPELIGFGIFFLFFLGLGFIALVKPIWLSDALGFLEIHYESVLENQQGTHPLWLVLFAFIGGVLGSISPCILAMLPMNLGYIGTLKIESHRDAFLKASAFVAGVVLVNSLFGLASGFAQLVMVSYRGYLFLGVGALTLAMAAAMLNWFHLPLPTVIKRMPASGPFVVGSAFALISSPCASPVLFAVLAMAATSGSLFWSVLTMAAYGLGYSTLIFLASLFTGLSKQLGVLKYHGTKVNHVSGALLLLAGLWAVTEGVRWFLQA